MAMKMLLLALAIAPLRADGPPEVLRVATSWRGARAQGPPIAGRVSPSRDAKYPPSAHCDHIKERPRRAQCRHAAWAAVRNPLRLGIRADRPRIEKKNVSSVRSYLMGSHLVSTTPYLSNDVYWELAEQVNARATGPPPIMFVPVPWAGLTADWLRRFLVNRTSPVILVTTHNGRAVDVPRRRGDALDVLLEDPRVVRVYTKNALYLSEKLFPLPLGPKWQYKSRAFFAEPMGRYRIKEALDAAGAGSAKKTKALFQTTFRTKQILFGHLGGTSRQRGQHVKAFKNSPVASNIITTQKRTFTEYLADMRTVAFVFSPPGAGRDCHRHWEALLVGAVPIVVQDNSNTRLFEGLPVWFVKSYGNISDEDVEKQYAHFYGATQEWDFEKLYTDFWLREFTHAAKTFKSGSLRR